jgi:hypothetical protein
MVNSSIRSTDGTPVTPANGQRYRTSARGAVAGLAVAATLLAVGIGMLYRGGPSEGHLAPGAGSSGADGLTSPGGSTSPRDAGEGYGQSPQTGGSMSGHAAGVTSPSAPTDPTLPADVLDRDVEYVVEDGTIVPQRMAPAATVPQRDDGEPSIPQGNPTAVPGPGTDDVSVPAGQGGPVVDVPDQQVPGPHGPAKGPEVSPPPYDEQAPAQQVPRL